jgi:hypothetical protein
MIVVPIQPVARSPRSMFALAITHYVPETRSCKTTAYWSQVLSARMIAWLGSCCCASAPLVPHPPTSHPLGVPLPDLSLLYCPSTTFRGCNGQQGRAALAGCILQTLVPRSTYLLPFHALSRSLSLLLCVVPHNFRTYDVAGRVAALMHPLVPDSNLIPVPSGALPRSSVLFLWCFHSASPQLTTKQARLFL